MSYALIGLVHGDRLPDAVYHHPVLRETSAVGNDLLSWFNDLLWMLESPRYPVPAAVADWIGHL